MSMYYQETFEISSALEGEMYDLTPDVQEIVSKSRVRIGLVHIFNIGSAAAISTTEFERGVLQDLPGFLNYLAPPSREYEREKTWHDGRGHAHLQAVLIGPGVTVPVNAGRLALGTWQQIFHIELEGRPRTREITVTVHGQL